VAVTSTWSSFSEESQVSGVSFQTSTVLQLTEDPSVGDQRVGIRFNSVAVPRQSFIQYAFIQFTCNQTSWASVGLNVYADVSILKIEFIDFIFNYLSLVFGCYSEFLSACLVVISQSSMSPRQFQKAYYDLAFRTPTSTSVLWEPQGWGTAGERSMVEQSADVSDILQELVSDVDWTNGNPVLFLISNASGNGSRWANSGIVGGGPTLQILYTSCEHAVSILVKSRIIAFRLCVFVTHEST
jgi:hypothetical protein